MDSPSSLSTVHRSTLFSTTASVPTSGDAVRSPQPPAVAHGTPRDGDASIQLRTRFAPNRRTSPPWRRKQQGNRQRTFLRHRLHFLLAVSLTALAASLVFLKRFYFACVLNANTPPLSPAFTRGMLPASLPSLPSPSSLRSPSPPSLSEPLWRGSVQRRLAEKQEESMSPALLDVCAPTSREGNESENGGGAPRASEEVLTSGQGVGRQEQSVSSRRRRRAAPVVDTNEEPQDEDAAAENQAKRGIGTKSKRKPADIESDDGSVDNLPTSKTVHQLPEKRPRWRLRVKPFVDIRSRLLSEDELRARLVVPELIPTPEQLPAWYNFYRVWFERLAVAMSKTQWRARSLGRGVQEINWSLRGIANSLLAINQFREIRKALPGCSDTALEWRAVNAQERLESGLRQALINVLGTEISFCVEQLEAELLRIAIGASMGVHRAAVKRRREAAFVGVDTTDPFSALLVNYASDLPWRLMGRIPLEELSGWLAREEDISNQIPEDSLFKRAVQAEIERTTEVTEDSQDPLPPGRGKVHIRWKEFSHSETAAPVFTEFLSEAVRSSQVFATALSDMMQRSASALKLSRWKLRKSPTLSMLGLVLRTIVRGSLLLSQASFLTQEYPSLKKDEAFLRNIKSLRLSLGTSWRTLSVDPATARTLQDVLDRFSLTATRKTRRRISSSTWTFYNEGTRLEAVADTTWRHLARLDLLAVVAQAIEGDARLQRAADGDLPPWSLMKFVRNYQTAGDEATEMESAGVEGKQGQQESGDKTSYEGSDTEFSDAESDILLSVHEAQEEDPEEELTFPEEWIQNPSLMLLDGDEAENAEDDDLTNQLFELLQSVEADSEHSDSLP